MADIKFSEFQKANQSKDSDEIAILQDGVNKMIPSPVLESKIINKTVSRVIDQGGASLNVINLKGVVPTYADLALITPTPELNDAYQVEADGLVYVYTESGFQGEGDGFIVQPEPNGVVEEGNTQAVSGGEVFDSITLFYLDKNVVLGWIDGVTGVFEPSNIRARIDEIMLLPENYKFDIEVVSGDLSIRSIVLYDENNVRLATLTDAFTATETKRYVSTTENPNYKKIAVSFWKFGSSAPITNQEILDTKIKISLGDRTSISELKNNINLIKYDLYENLSTPLEYGGIRDANGEYVENFVRLRSNNFIDVSNKVGKTLHFLSDNPNIYPNAITKWLDGVFVSGTVFVNPILVDNTFNQIKVSYRKTDNSTITYFDNLNFNPIVSDLETLKVKDNTNKLKGKTLHTIGSSNLTNEYGRWAQDLCIYNQMLYTTSGIAGAQIAKKPSFAYKSGVEQLEDYILTEVKPNILMLSSGLNDSFRPPITPLGDWEVVKTTDIATIRATDTNTTYGINTFYGALKYIAEKMIAEFPDTRIVFNVPFQCWKGRADTFDNYAQAIRDVAKYYSITLIDSWGEGTFKRTAEFEGLVGRYTIDGIHTVLNNVINDKGRKVQAYFMSNEFHNKMF